MQLGYDFRQISRFISEMIQDRAIDIMERHWESVYDLSNIHVSTTEKKLKNIIKSEQLI